MRLEVRLFGGIAARAGASRVEVDLPEDATTSSVVVALAATVPTVEALLSSAKIAVNLEVASAEQPIGPDDEVAVLPPVAGGSDQPSGRLSEAAILTGLRAPPLPVAEALAAVASPSAGATSLFIGTVRDHADGLEEVERLEYTAYDGMAEAVLRTIAEETAERWPEIRGVALLHAVGDLPVGAETIVIACSAPHRQESQAACHWALEEVKARVPVWKQEVGPDGSRWVGLDGC
jgi:MoaE-MoaD fusion protein